MASRNCQGRKLHWKICLSEQVADLKDPWAKLLFTWLIPSVDNLGRMEGEPYQVKGTIFPYEESITPEHVEQMLEALHDAGLIIWYRAHRLRYLQLPRFAAYQRLVGNMKAESDYPAPAAQDIRAWEDRWNPVHTAYEHGTNAVSTEGEEEEEEEGKLQRARARESGGGFEEHQEDDPLLWDLWEVPGWPRDDTQDRKELADAKRDYPKANLSEVIADLRAEAPLKQPRKALRAFAKHAHECAPAERPQPGEVPALPEVTPEQNASNLAEARRAREKIAAMAAGMRGMP